MADIKQMVDYRQIFFNSGWREEERDLGCETEFGIWICLQPKIYKDSVSGKKKAKASSSCFKTFVMSSKLLIYSSKTSLDRISEC